MSTLGVLRVAAIALALAARAHAQARNPSIAGTVFDSLRMLPLRGATVEAVDASAATSSTVYHARTDSTGRFEISGVPPGKYLVGFSHALLDSLLIETPPRSVDVSTATTDVTLAVPSLASVGKAMCRGVGASDTTGIVLGRTYRAQTLTPSSEVQVVVWWNDLILGSTGMRQRQSRSTVTTTADGLFVFCAVPTRAEVGLQARTATDSTSVVALTIARRGAYRRDLFLGQGADERGGPQSDVVLRGVVRATDGRPLSGASVRILGLSLNGVAGDDGRFQLRAPTIGTREMEVRLVGFAPEKRVVDLRAGELPPLDIELRTVQQIMDTVKVRAPRVYDAGRTGFAARRRSGLGSYFDTTDVERLHPKDVTDLIRRAAGVTIEDDALGGIITMRGSSLDAPRCVPTFFVDGQRIEDLDVRDLNMMIKPEEMEGMEVYATGERTPAQFTTLQGCGTIIIWSRPPGAGRKKP